MKNNVSLPEFDLSNSRVIQRVKLNTLDHLRIRMSNSGDDDYKKPLCLGAFAVQTNSSSLLGLSLQSRKVENTSSRKGFFMNSFASTSRNFVHFALKIKNLWITGIFLTKKPVMTVKIYEYFKNLACRCVSKIF